MEVKWQGYLHPEMYSMKNEICTQTFTCGCATWKPLFHSLFQEIYSWKRRNFFSVLKVSSGTLLFLENKYIRYLVRSYPLGKERGVIRSRGMETAVEHLLLTLSSAVRKEKVIKWNQMGQVWSQGDGLLLKSLPQDAVAAEGDGGPTRDWGQP